MSSLSGKRKSSESANYRTGISDRQSESSRLLYAKASCDLRSAQLLVER